MSSPPVLECAEYRVELCPVALMRIRSWGWLFGPREVDFSCGEQGIDEALEFLVVPGRHFAVVYRFKPEILERLFEDLCPFRVEPLVSCLGRLCMRSWRSPARLVHSRWNCWRWYDWLNNLWWKDAINSMRSRSWNRPARLLRSQTLR